MDASSRGGDAAMPLRIPRRRRSALRRIWLQVHLWVGLAAGLVAALTGLSGSLLVFSGPLLRAELGDFGAPPISAPARWAPVGVWIAKTRARYPDLESIDTVVSTGAAPVHWPTPLLVGHVHSGPPGAEVFGGHMVVSIDPATGEPLGKFLFEETWAGTIMMFHTELLAGLFGGSVVAWSGLAALILSIGSGLYLWWPRPGQWRWAFWFRSGFGKRRRLLDLHNVATLWLLAPLILVIASGIYIVRPQWFDPGLRLASDIREPDLEALKNETRPRCGTLGVDAAVALAMRDRPGWALRLMWIPEDAAEPYYVGLMRPDGDPKVMATEIWIDRSCPTILFAREGERLTAAELVKSWTVRIHTDLGLGTLGQVLVFLTGLLLPVLWITGVLLWLSRPRALGRRFSFATILLRGSTRSREPQS